MKIDEYKPKHMKERSDETFTFSAKIIEATPLEKFEAKENVSHPSHYNKGIETIDYIESWEMNFNRGNIIKYVTRSPYKGKELEDLKKARFYLDREIAKLEK